MAVVVAFTSEEGVISMEEIRLLEGLPVTVHWGGRWPW